MANGRPMAVLEVSDAERRELESLARRRKTAQALALRARIVLHCAEGLTNIEVSTRLGVARPTVGKWRQRFVSHRLDGLHDEPRPGAPRSITDDHVAKVVTLTLESKPKNATHWSTRSMAERAALPRRQSAGFGGLSASSPIARARSRSAKTHSSSTRFVTSSACT